MINYWRVLIKAVLTGVLALTFTLIITSIFVPMMGGKLAGAGLVMTIVCPLATAIPMSALHYLSSERLRIARDEALQAQNALEQANILLRKFTREDSLTGVLNRATFLDEFFAISKTGQSGGLLFIDLDYFKTINDTYGHATGDAALRRLGLLLKRLTAGKAFTGRLGGEEFGVFIKNSNPDYIHHYAEEIREKISSLRIIAQNNQNIRITASIGVTICETAFDPAQALLDADEKMYLAKRRGRNVIIA